MYIRRKTSNDAIDTVVHSSAIRLGPRLSSGGKEADIFKRIARRREVKQEEDSK